MISLQYSKTVGYIQMEVIAFNNLQIKKYICNY